MSVLHIWLHHLPVPFFFLFLFKRSDMFSPSSPFFYCPSFAFHHFWWNIDFYYCCTTFYCSRFNGFPQVVASIYTFIYRYSEAMTSSHYFKKVKLLNIDYNSGQNTSQQLNSPPPIVPTPEMYCLGWLVSGTFKIKVRDLST